MLKSFTFHGEGIHFINRIVYRNTVYDSIDKMYTFPMEGREILLERNCISPEETVIFLISRCRQFHGLALQCLWSFSAHNSSQNRIKQIFFGILDFFSSFPKQKCGNRLLSIWKVYILSMNRIHFPRRP